jgi:hypothetical protein
MVAAMIYSNYEPPRFHYAMGGSTDFPSVVEPTHMAGGGLAAADGGAIADYLSKAKGLGKAALHTLGAIGPVASIAAMRHELRDAAINNRAPDMDLLKRHAYDAITSNAFVAPDYDTVSSVLPKAASNIYEGNWPGVTQNAKELGFNMVPGHELIESYLQSNK